MTLMTEEALYFRKHIFCCSNQRPAGHERGCCASKGAEQLRNYMKRRAKEMGLTDVRVNNAGCLDRCAEVLKDDRCAEAVQNDCSAEVAQDDQLAAVGPVIVIYPEGVWYRPQNEADIDEILTSHIQSGVYVDRLRLPSQRV